MARLKATVRRKRRTTHQATHQVHEYDDDYVFLDLGGQSAEEVKRRIEEAPGSTLWPREGEQEGTVRKATIVCLTIVQD